MAKDYITLSDKHGVNPSLMQCFVCGKDVGVALFGRMKGDQEAPRRVCLDQEPCDACREFMKLGIILISVDGERSKDDLKNPYRTGGWVVVTEDYIRRTVTEPELLKQTLEARVAFLPDEVWNALGLPRGDQKEGV